MFFISQLADGSYAAQSAVDPSLLKARNSPEETLPSLRKIIVEGNYFVGAALAATLTKMVIRLFTIVGPDNEQAKARGEYGYNIVISLAHRDDNYAPI